MAQVVEQTRLRGAGALDHVLRGERVGPPLAARRWPLAIAAALAGACAGALVVLVLRRLLGEDAPDAQEPDELVAVIDPGTSPS